MPGLVSFRASLALIIPQFLLRGETKAYVLSHPLVSLLRQVRFFDLKDFIMADRYWVGGAGTWDNSATTNWSTTSGGAGGASAPTASDNVFFNSASNATGYTVTLATTARCLDWTAAGPASGNVTFALAAFPISGSISWAATNVLFTGSSTITLNATTSGKTVTTNNIAFSGAFFFNGVGGVWTLGSDLTTSQTFGMHNGTVDLDEHVVTAQFFDGGSGTRTLDYGSTGTGKIVITGNNTTVWALSFASTFTTLGTPNVEATYSGSTGTRTFTNGAAGPTANAYNLKITGGTDAIVFSNNNIMNTLDMTGWLGSVSFSTTFVYGSGTAVTIPSGATVTTTAFNFAGSGNTQTFSVPTTYTGGLAVSGAGNTFQMPASLTLSGTVTLTSGTLDLNNYTLTAGIFSSSSSNTRVIAFGTGKIILTGNAATVISAATATNLTYTGTPNIELSYSGATGTRTISFGSSSSSGTETNSPNIKVTAGTDTVAITSNGTCKDLDLSGFSGTLTSTNRTIFGSLLLGSGNTLTAGATTTTFAGTSGSKTITTAGKTLDFALTFNGAGSTWTLQDNLTSGSTRTSTLTAGSLDLNDKVFSTGLFASANGNTRSIAFGSIGKFLITGSGNTIWNTSTMTGMTLSGTTNIECNYSGSVGTRTFSTLSGAESVSMNFLISAGTDIIVFGGGVRNLDFTGFSGTYSPTAMSVYGNYTLSTGMTLSASASALTFGATSGTQLITSNGKTSDCPVTFSGTGGTFQLQDNLLLGSTRTATLTSGTLALNGHTLTCSVFSTSNSNVRAVNFGTAGAISVSATGTAFSCGTSTNMTVSGTGKVSLTHATSMTFAGGGLTWPVLENAGGGVLTVTGANTFADITTTVAPAGITLPSSATTTVNSFSLSGTSGSLVTLRASTAGTQAILSKPSGTVTVSYLDIKDINATGGATWTASNGSNVDTGNNAGWNFGGSPSINALTLSYNF
jgi:hypothetical protein